MRFQKKTFNRDKIIRKAANNVTKAHVAMKAGKFIAATGATVTVGALPITVKKPVTGLGLSFIGLGVSNLGAFVTFKGARSERAFLARCVGKPRVAAKIAKQVKNKRLKELFETLARLKNISPTQKEALVNFFHRKADAIERNVAKRLLKEAFRKYSTES